MQKPAIIFSPAYTADIGHHVFPMEKYTLLADFLRTNNIADQFDWFEPGPASRHELALAHSEAYLDSFLGLKMDRHTSASELPLTRELVNASLLMAGGTIMAAQLALTRNGAANLGGGFHHAMPEHAEGFCYINDIAVAICVLLQNKQINKALVIDCDLHQGNGTACIFQNDPRVFTFSIHQENLYPKKEKSSFDIGLPDFTGDKEYLDLLNGALSKIFTAFSPDIVIYQAGADPYQEDQLGLLNLTMEGLKTRDKIVIETSLSRTIPIAVTLGGGYAAKVSDTVQIHANTITLLAESLKNNI